MVSAGHEDPTRSAFTPAFTNGFLIRRTLFVVRETRLASKMSITLGVADSDGGESARGSRHTIATRLVTHVHNVLPRPVVTFFTYILFRQRTRYIHDHVIVLFDIKVE
jgi:hypothetical protein